MHTTTLCTAGVFSSTIISDPWGPQYPISAMVAVPSSSSRRLNSGSTHARATTLAPFMGPMSCSNFCTMKSIASLERSPFSASNDSMALVRSAA